MNRILPWLLLFVGVGCQQAPTADAQDSTAHATSTATPEIFGAPLSQAREVPLVDVLSKPQSYEGQAIRVSGVARRVCQRKGCWMELSASSESEAPACRVKFKDYGFFVPTDSAGSRATLEGDVKVNRVLPGRVRHLEKEGAVFASKNADGSANEIQIVATGVELVRGTR